ncbi:MAG TPA: hypothetical protein VE732_06645 [Nitrososphaera sp.]|jgi:phage FluMu protein Com|nr:hypothetical protein [Nitrososphaera sp.]
MAIGDMAEGLNTNSAAESGLPGYVLEEIRCHWCRRIQMAISPEVVGVIRWKCKSCRNWNAFEFFASGKDSGNVSRRMRFVSGEGRSKREHSR